MGQKRPLDGVVVVGAEVRVIPVKAVVLFGADGEAVGEVGTGRDWGLGDAGGAIHLRGTMLEKTCVGGRGFGSAGSLRRLGGLSRDRYGKRA